MTTHADVQAAWRALALLATGIVPTKLSLDPQPCDIREVKNDLYLLTDKVDALVSAYAAYVSAHTGHRIEVEHSHNQLLRQIDGNLLYEIESAAEDIEQQVMEAYHS
jgi:hypothetical protein